MKKLALMATIFILLAVLIAPVSPVGASPDQETLRPNADGTYVEWSVTANATHYGATSDGSDATYVYTSILGAKEFVNVDAPTFPDSAVINWVQAHYRCYAPGGAGTKEKLDLYIISDGTETLTDSNLVVNRSTFTDIAGMAQTTNPATGNPWTTANVTSLQAGLIVTALDTGETIQCSEAWVVVDYTLPDISNFPNEWNLGTVIADSIYDTDLDYFTVTNNSAFAVNISIGGEDMTGGDIPWTLDNFGNPGTNTYALNAGLAGDSYNVIVKKAPPYNTLVPNLAVSANQSWGLQFWAPTSFDEYGVSKSANVTLTATQP